MITLSNPTNNLNNLSKKFVIIFFCHVTILHIRLHVTIIIIIVTIYMLYHVLFFVKNQLSFKIVIASSRRCKNGLKRAKKIQYQYCIALIL